MASKTTKKPKKRTKPPTGRAAANPETPKPENLDEMSRSELQKASESYAEVREGLSEQIRACNAKLAQDRAEDAPVDVQLSSHLKFLGDGMGVITRELRQIEKHQWNTAAQIPAEEADELVVSYILEALPPKRREWVLDRLGVAPKEKRGLL